MSTKRDDIIETTCHLLETQGYHATGLNQIVAESGAPKGSLYHYFPEGKEELTAEAVHRTADLIADRIRTHLDSYEDPAPAVRDFLLNISRHVVATNYQEGGPITTVALESVTSSERVNQACQEAYGRWQQAFAGKLRQSGYAAGQAERLSNLIIAVIEGAVILSRTRRSPEPLEEAAQELEQLLTPLPYPPSL